MRLLDSAKAPAAQRAPRPASGLPRQARACVVGLEGNGAEAERLAAMGLAVGTVFEVLRGGGSLAVKVGESTLALGPEWAAALRVVEI